MPEDPPTHNEFIPGITFHHQSITYLLEERRLLHQHTSISLQLQETGAASASPGQQPPQSAPAGLSAIHDPGGSQQDPGGDGQVTAAATSCALLHQSSPSPSCIRGANRPPQGAYSLPLDHFHTQQTEAVWQPPVHNPLIAHAGSYGTHLITENNFPAVSPS